MRSAELADLLHRHVHVVLGRQVARGGGGSRSPRRAGRAGPRRRPARPGRCPPAASGHGRRPGRGAGAGGCRARRRPDDRRRLRWTGSGPGPGARGDRSFGSLVGALVGSSVPRLLGLAARAPARAAAPRGRAVSARSAPLRTLGPRRALGPLGCVGLLGAVDRASARPSPRRPAPLPSAWESDTPARRRMRSTMSALRARDGGFWPSDSAIWLSSSRSLRSRTDGSKPLMGNPRFQWREEWAFSGSGRRAPPRRTSAVSATTPRSSTTVESDRSGGTSAV